MGNDLTDLKAAVDEFEGHGLYETDGGYSKASRKLEYLEMVKGRQDIYLTLCTGDFLPISRGLISAPFPIENSHLFPQYHV